MLSAMRSQRIPAMSARQFMGSRGIAVSTIPRTSHMVDPEKAKEELEAGKQASIKGSENPAAVHKHAPGWNETIASESEAFIKAETADASSPESLVQETIERVTEKHGNATVTQEKKTTVKS